jgi:shikimate dehydrogenase
MARRAGIDFADKKVLILGGGGTSLTVRRAAYDGGAGKIVTVSRTGAVNYNNVYTHHDADIIVNTTPVGMYPDNSGEIIDLRGFDKLCGVIDVIYNPLNTNLTLQAKRLGIPSSGGLPMLVAQAVFAAELFTGETFSGDVTEKVLSDVMKDILNIVLIGMPGSGKTAVGKIIAQKLGREFIDTDSEVERASKMPIPDIFKAYGEDYFRALEAQAVRKAAAKCAVVISTGGGVPMSEANRRAIAQNGFTCYIERELEKLQTDGRPLSAGANALTDMYDRRHPLYLSMCDIRYKAGEGRLDEAADYIIGQFLRTV